MIIIFITTIYLLFYTTPFLAILAIFAAYELIRRSSGKVQKMNHYIKEYNPPTQEEKDDKMLELNPVKIETLEEEVVYKMAPIGKSETNTYIETSYKPIADPLFCGSMCN